MYLRSIKYKYYFLVSVTNLMELYDLNESHCPKYASVF